MILYRTTLVNPSSDYTDFNTNYSASSTLADLVNIPLFQLVIPKTWTEIKALISNWSGRVYHTTDGTNYYIYYAVSSDGIPDAKATLWDRNTSQGLTVRTVYSSPANFHGMNIINPNAVMVYLKLYNVASGTTVTVGTTVPTKTLAIPSGVTVSVSKEPVHEFSLGIKSVVTLNLADSDNTAPTTNIHCEIAYKIL